MLAIPLYPSVGFRLWQVPVCAVVLWYMFDVLLAVFVVWLAVRVLVIDLEIVVEMEFEVIVAAAFAVVADPIEDPTLTADAGLIDEAIPRLEAALLPEVFGTQHSARLEDEIMTRYAKLTSVP